MFKLKNANYDSVSGESFATIVTELGEFSGMARLHEEDRDKASGFFGCEIAEIRALIKYAKKRKSIAFHQYKVLNNLYKNLSQIKEFNEDSFEIKKIRRCIRRSINEHFNEYDNWKDNIKMLEESIDKKCVMREKMLENISNKKGKTE